MSAPSDAPIEEAAASHLQSWATALTIQGPSPAPSTLSSLAASTMAHFAPHATILSHGCSLPTSIEGGLAFYEALMRFGIGLDFRVLRSRIEGYGEGFAVVWVTYNLVPIDGRESVEFEVVYGYRRGLGWEWLVNDKEVDALKALEPRWGEDVKKGEVEGG